MTKYTYKPYDAKWTAKPNHVPPGPSTDPRIVTDLKWIEKVETYVTFTPKKSYSLWHFISWVVILLVGLSIILYSII